MNRIMRFRPPRCWWLHRSRSSSRSAATGGFAELATGLINSPAGSKLACQSSSGSWIKRAATYGSLLVREGAGGAGAKDRTRRQSEKLVECYWQRLGHQQGVEEPVAPDPVAVGVSPRLAESE